MPQYDITLRDYWRIVRKRKLYIIFATIMLGFTSFATAYFSKPELKFRTEAKVQFERSLSAQEAYVSALSGSDDLETQQAVIKSYDVVERIAHRLGYVDTTTASEDERIQAILNLRPLLNTSIEGLTNIITISITHSNRFTAREIANTAAEEYRQYNYEVRNAQLLKTRLLIQSRRDTVLARLKRSQDELKLFQEQTQIISINTATTSVLSELGRSRDLRDNLLSLQTNIDKLLASKNQVDENQLLTFPPEEGGSRFVELLRNLQALNQERNRFLVTYTEQHPEIVRLDDRKRVILSQMLDALRVQREILSKRVQIQQTDVDTLELRFNQLPDKGIQLEGLYRNVDIQSTLLQAIEEEFQQAQIAQGEEIREVTILQRALLPSSPINPSAPTTIAGVGAILGLIIGMVAAFIAETLDTSIGTIEDVEQYLGVSVVGIIPQMDPESMREALEARTGQPVEIEFVEKRLRLSTHFEPQSTLAESYRALRTNVQFANLEKGAKILSITSSSHQEGKSTTTANLAVTLAQAGNRVLLVDGDLRRPTINRIFGLEREPGLTDVILGNYTWREVVRTVTDIMVGGLGMDNIMMTAGMDNLNIITSGILPPNPAEIIDARRMTEFLQEVKEAYDVVLVDSPPVLQATDATVLGTKVDGVLLVYKIGNVSRSALRRAKLQLDNVGVTTLGVIINGLRADVSEDFRDLRYSSYYTYGTHSEVEEGPYLSRLYKRTLRQIDNFKKTFAEQTKPFVDLAKERMPVIGRLLDRSEAPTDQEEPIEEERDLTSKILSVCFWILLLVFMAAGIMWQLGKLPITPGQTTQPTIQVAPTPSQESAPITKPESAPSQEPATEPTAKPAQPENPTPQTTPVDSQASKSTGSQPSSPDTTKILQQPDFQSASRPVGKTQPKNSVAVSLTKEQKTLFAIQASSHKVMTSANQEASNYKKQGYSVQIIPIHIEGRGLFYRVLVGQFKNKQAGQEALLGFKNKNRIQQATIVLLPATNTPMPSHWGDENRPN